MTNQKLFTLLWMLMVGSTALAGPDSWTLNEQDFANSMTYTVRVDLPAGLMATEEDMLGAFVDGTCRGVVNPIQLADDDAFYFLLLIYSNETAGEQVTLQYYNAARDEVFELSGTYDFVSEQVVGTFSNPVTIEVPASVITSTTNEKMQTLNIYPIPATNSLTFSRPSLGITARIMIVDLRGRLLLNKTLSTGELSETIDVSHLRSGAYSLIYSDEHQSLNQQFIKQ